MLGLIRGTFTYVSKEVLIPLYTLLVYHYIEYGGVLRNDIANRAQIRAVEKIQMRAVSLVEGMQDLDYGEQLQALRLTTLSARRARGMMIEMWKHFHIYDRDTVGKSFRPGVSGRRNFECHRLRSTGKHSKTFYAAAGVAWNKLPNDVRLSPNINTFKARLDRCWNNIPITYDFLAVPLWMIMDDNGEVPLLE